MYGPQLQSGQEYTLRFGNGHYFTAEPNGTYRYNANAIGDWEKFRLNNEGNNRWSLRTAHGKVVCYDQGKNSFDVRDAVGDWEKFEFHPSGNGGFHMHCPAQRVFFNFDQGHARHVPDQHHSSIVWLTLANQAQQQGYPQGYPPQQQGYPQQQQQYGNMNINVSTNLQSGQEYTIRLPHGRYLTAEPNGTYRMDADRVGDWEKFRFNAENNGQFSLRTAHGKVVCYDQGKSKFETRDAAGDWEKFEFRPSGNGAFHMYCPAQRIFIQFEHNGNTRAVQDHHHASQLHIAPANQSGQGQPQYNQYNQQPQYNQYGGQPQYNQQPQYGQPPSPFANGNLTTGCYFIRNYHGKFLSIDRSRVHQEQAPGADERLMIQEVGPSQFGIRSAANGRVICFDDSGRIELRDNIGAWETVEIRPVPNRFGFFSIYNASQRKYLSCNHHGGVTASHQLGDSEVYQFLPTA